MKVHWEEVAVFCMTGNGKCCFVSGMQNNMNNRGVCVTLLWIASVGLIQLQSMNYDEACFVQKICENPCFACCILPVVANLAMVTIHSSTLEGH